MSGSGVEQASGTRNSQPPFGRQSSAPSYTQSVNDAFSPFEVSPITPFSPSSTLAHTTYPSSRRSGFESIDSISISANHLHSGGQPEETGRDSPDPDDYYRQSPSLSAPLKAGVGNVTGARDGMVSGPSPNERVSALPANVLESSRTRRPILRSVSDSPTLGEGPANVSSAATSINPRQPSFRDLINRFNNTSDSVLPLPSTSRSTSRAASPTGSEHGSERSSLSRRRQLRESLPPILDVSSPTVQTESPTSLPQTQGPSKPLTTVPPPLYQRIPESHPRRPLFGELLTLDTQLTTLGLGIPAHLRRRGSDGSIPSPNPAFLDLANPSSIRTPLTPTAWYLGQANSLEAVQSSGRTNLSHRRSRSDFSHRYEGRWFRLVCHDSAWPPGHGRWPNPSFGSGSEQAPTSLRLCSTPQKSPPLRSSRPRQTISNAGSSSSRSPRSPEIGKRLSSLQKVADRGAERNNPRSRQRQLPELGNVDFETRRQRIQQAFNRSVQENERKEEEEAELRRRTRVVVVPESPEDEQTTPSAATSNHPLPIGMTTTITESIEAPVDDVEPRTVPQLYLNTSVPVSENNAPHTTMDSPTLGLPDGSQRELLNNGAPGLRVPDAPDSASSDDTHFDPEPQTHLIPRKPSAAQTHRTLLNHIMQIRESSSSSESCDEPECSMSENDDKESIKIMLPGPSFFRSSSTLDHQDARKAQPLQQSKAVDPSDPRWSMSSWSSSVHNQESTCDEHCEEDSGEDSVLQGPNPGIEEPPAEPCSAASTRPASFADDEHEDGPFQDLGLMGPDTLQTSQLPASNLFSTPPILVKRGKWDSRRVTQLYLEELARGRAPDHGLPAARVSPGLPPARASPALSAARQTPAPPLREYTVGLQENKSQDIRVPAMRIDAPADDLADEPVVVPRFQDPSVMSNRHSNAASLVGPGDWEDASPSVMDWMQMAAEDDQVTPANDRPEFMNDGLGLTNTELPVEPQASLGPSAAFQSIHSQPQPSHNHQIPPIHLPAVSHSAGSSEDSSLRRIEPIHSDQAAGSSVTSLAPSAENPVRMDSRKSPSPEQRRLKKRRNVIKELVDTEHTFGRDMKVVDDIYKGTSGSCLDLSPEDVKILFGNSNDIVQFSQSFQDALKQAARSIYIMPKSQRWSSKRNADRPASQAVEEESADAGFSDLEKDRATNIGQAFVTNMAQMERVYSEYLKNYDAANKKLQILQGNPKVDIWLRECRDWAADLTTAWDLDSLLVKPVQRILKYPLLLNELLAATPTDHPDHAQLLNARTEVTNVSIRINDMKKRVDVVGQVVGRKRNQSDVRAGLSKAFGRRTEKFRQQVGMSDLVEDKEYDALSHSFGDGFFQLQVVMRDVEMYTQETTRAMDQLNDFVLAIESMINVSPSHYTELEVKWRLFKNSIREIITVDLPEHLAVVRKSVIQPMVTLLKIHEGPQRVMKKRDKRLIDYGRYKALVDRGDKPDKKTTEQGEQYTALNETLKEELPRLYALTAKLMEACLKNFVQIQTTWWGIMQKKVGAHVDAFPDAFEKLISDWSSDYSLAEAQVLSLGICNGALLADTVNLVNFNTPSVGVGGMASPRRPSMSSTRRTSTANSSTHRRSIIEDSPKISQDFGGVSQLFQSPRIESSSSISRHRADSTFSSRPIPESPDTSRSLQQVTHSSSAAGDSQHSAGTEAFPSLPRLSIDGPLLAEILRATSGGNDPSVAPARTSGLFSSAMPMSDNPNEHEPPQDPEVHAPKEPAVLFLAASLYEFNIDRARREAGYPYLTYVAGEIFDVFGEKGELWLARNQDDSTSQVGWIWMKHFAKLSS
ncbi:hypothetical protein N7494_002458 [Penicillium frequentans]|uniref:Dynamin-binding protein n=1 Tax=Penicillium frequentans TaxID=3151616 RepID=A0AAD6D3W2_9EURO|nr:hypothetical protein N7494_002458 [Penicillium glabrum]